MILPGGFRLRDHSQFAGGGEVWRGSRPTAIKLPRQIPQVIVGGIAKATTGSGQRKLPTDRRLGGN